MKKAVGIKYDMEVDRAPQIIAKGSGSLAERIIAIARENNIPIYEDPDLVGLLAIVDLYREIPQKTYQVIAEILAFIYSMNAKWKEKKELI
ncbi:EscU/YscU/HrcU family type III secretion system export apparatus switch protein [bacterium]|nr:EscU/YscU/HrcU family type III secretion system export apparatus switch protein [bacterium]